MPNSGRAYQWAADGTRIKSRKPQPFTLDRQVKDLLQPRPSALRICSDCSSDKWTIIEGVAVCRQCGKEMNKP